MEFYFDEIEGRVLVLRADGGLNRDTADQFVGELEKLVQAGLRRIIVDCGGLDFVSSYGLGVLVRIHHTLARQGGDVKLAAVPSALFQVLDRVRFGQLFEIYPDVNRARLAFRPRSEEGV